MRKYENGILVPILPNLLQDDTFWISMATMDLEEFQKKLDKLTASIRLPLEILKSRFSGLGKDLYDEVCDRFAREIMYGEEKDKVSWLESFDKFFREYSEDKLGKFSITKLVEERREKNDNDPVIPYITEILLNHKEEFEKNSADDKTIKNREEIQRAKSTVEENWKDFPMPVKNCLIERKVSGADQRTMLREATWLKQAYDLAENMVEQLPAEEKKHILDREKILWELLMYTYLERVKEKEYNFDLNPDLSMLQKDFENLKGRHQSMAGLQEVSYVWSEQYQPVFWELNQDVHTKTEREENPVLAPYRHLVMEALAVGMYTMK